MGSVKPPGRLQDKVAIVTGSSSGLGRAISLRYAQEGAKVVCADLKPTARPQVPGESASTTIELIEQAGGEGIAVPCDVGKASDMESLVQKAVEKYGRLDVRVPSATLWGEDRPLTSGSIVNNAGIAIESTDPQPIHTTTEETWDTTMTVNAKSVFLGCKYAIAQMLKQDAHPSGDRGWIINVSSIYGLVGGGQNRKCPTL